MLKEEEMCFERMIYKTTLYAVEKQMNFVEKQCCMWKQDVVLSNADLT